MGTISEQLASRISDLPAIVAFRNLLIHGHAIIDESGGRSTNRCHRYAPQSLPCWRGWGLPDAPGSSLGNRVAGCWRATGGLKANQLLILQNLAISHKLLAKC